MRLTFTAKHILRTPARLVPAGVFLLLTTLAGARNPAVEPPMEPMDAVVAAVDGQIITLRDLHYRVFEARLFQPELRLEYWEALAPAFAREAVAEVQLYRHFWRPEINADEAAVRESASQSWNRWEQVSGSAWALRNRIEEAGLGEADLRAWLEERAERLWFIDGGVASKIDPELLNAGADTVEDADRVRLARLVILAENDSPEAVAEARRRATEVQVHLADQMPFADAVRLFSDDEIARETGGELGWVDRDVMQQELFDLIAGLERGGWAGPREERPGEFAFYRLTDYETPAQRDLRETIQELRGGILERLRDETDTVWSAEYLPAAAAAAEAKPSDSP